MKPRSAEVASILARTFQLATTNGHLVGKVDRGGFQFLAGGWLEVFIWDLLTRHREALGIWDIHLGLHVRHAEKKLSQNEFDVAFLCDFTLGLVECKSGAQRIDRDTNVLYKLAALARQFGAVRVRSWLVTMSPNVWQRDAGTFKPEIAERAALYGCRIVDQNVVRQLAERPDDAELVRRTFFPTTSEASPGG